MLQKFGFHIPTQLVFGAGQLKTLANLPLPGKKALIVISAGASVKRNGTLDVVLQQLQAAGVASEVFDKIQPNPIRPTVAAGAELARATGCDFVIGLGGGSAIDSAKAIALVAANGGELWDYIPKGSGKGIPFDKVLPIVAIPTTAGTGTEVDPWSVVTDEQLGEKLGFGSTLLYPRLAIVDPETMLSIPATLTAYQGFDAFFHAAEGYLNAKNSTPITDMYALEAIRLLYKYLPVAVADGRNIEARSKVAWASTLAGMVISTSSCISQHAMEHAMSAYYPKLPHGAGLIAISLAWFKAFKNDAMKRYMKMAEKMTQQKSARPSDLLDALAVMQKACRVDDLRMSDYGITPADFERFAANAIGNGQRNFDMDPRFLSRDEVIGIYSASYK